MRRPSPPWRTRHPGRLSSRKGPGVRGFHNVAKKRLDLIKTTRGRARIPGDVGDVAHELPQVPADERVLFDPDHAREGSSV